MLQASQALQLFNSPLGRAALGAVAGGGGALVYNQFSDNDINPLVAAGIGAGVGGASRFVEDPIRDWAFDKQMVKAKQVGTPMSDDEFFSGNWNYNKQPVNSVVSIPAEALEDFALDAVPIRQMRRGNVVQQVKPNQWVNIPDNQFEEFTFRTQPMMYG